MNKLKKFFFVLLAIYVIGISLSIFLFKDELFSDFKTIILYPHLAIAIIFILLYLFNRVVSKNLIIIRSYILYLIYTIYDIVVVLVSYLTNDEVAINKYMPLYKYIVIISGVTFVFFLICLSVNLFNLKKDRVFSLTSKIYDDICESNLSYTDKNNLIRELNGYYNDLDLAHIKKMRLDKKVLKDEVLNSYFKKKLIRYFLTNLGCYFLLFISLGLAYPFVFCLKLRLDTKFICYDNHKLDFTGRGSSLIARWILWFFLSIITLGIFTIFIPKQINKFKISNTHFVDLKSQGKSEFNGHFFTSFLLNFVIVFLNIVTFFLIYPFTICLKNRWKYKHLTYDGYKLTFMGRARDLYHKYLFWFFLSLITFGLFSIYSQTRIKKWEVANTHLVFIVEPYLKRQEKNAKLLKIKDGKKC